MTNAKKNLIGIAGFVAVMLSVALAFSQGHGPRHNTNIGLPEGMVKGNADGEPELAVPHTDYNVPPVANGIGFRAADGVGGTVTQGTNRTTTVVLSKLTGKIITTADSMAAQTPTTFTVTNTTVAATDVVVLSKLSGDVDTFAWVNSTASGSFTVTLFNTHASAADTTAFACNFAVIKSAIN